MVRLIYIDNKGVEHTVDVDIEDSMEATVKEIKHG